MTGAWSASSTSGRSAPASGPDDVLRLAASAERALDHPVARAIARHAREHDIQLHACTAWDYIVGQGVVAEIDGQTVHVGSRLLMEAAGIDVDAKLRTGSRPRHTSPSPTSTSRADGDLVGVISCRDSIRSESADVVADCGA